MGEQIGLEKLEKSGLEKFRPSNTLDIKSWCAAYKENAAKQEYNFDGFNIPVSVSKYSHSVLFVQIPEGEDPDHLKLSFSVAGQHSSCKDTDGKDCAMSYLPPNLISVQAELDADTGVPNANTEGGLNLL